MDKGKAVMGSGRRWAIDFSDYSTSPSSRDIPDPSGFSRASQDQDDSAVTKQKKDAEANWKAQKAWEVAQAPFKNLLMMGFMMWMAGNTVHLFSIGITFSALWQPISALQGIGKGNLSIGFSRAVLKALGEILMSFYMNAVFIAFLWLVTLFLLWLACVIFEFFWDFMSPMDNGCSLHPLACPFFQISSIGLFLFVVFEPYKDSKVDLLGPKLLFIALNLGGLALGIWKLNTLGLLPTHASDWVSSLPPAQEVEYSGGGMPLLH